MGKATAVKEDITNVELEEIEWGVKFVREDAGQFGTKVVERRESDKVKRHVDIHIGYEFKAMIGKKEVIIALYINVPVEIDPAIYYPITEWRITQDLLDDADLWPQWKRFSVELNGQEQRQQNGRPMLAQYLVYRAIQTRPEDSDGVFENTPPFMSSLVQETDIGIAVVKGSDIDDYIAEMSGTRIGASRRRGTEYNVQG